MSLMQKQASLLLVEAMRGRGRGAGYPEEFLALAMNYSLIRAAQISIYLEEDSSGRA